MLTRKNMTARKCVFFFIIATVVGTAALVLAIMWYQRSSSAWERKWLTGIPCRAPCWEGVTPGRTTVTDTIQLLQHNTPIGNLNYSRSDRDADNEIFWEGWRNDHGTGRIVYDRSTSIVSRISLSLPHDFTLGEVAAAYGQPSHVIALAARNLEKLNEIDYTLEMYWQSQGIVLDWARQYPPRRPTIEPNLKFHSVGFFEATAAGLEHLVRSGNPDHLKFLDPWKGFVDFRDYCHVVDSGGGFDPQACEEKQQ